MLLELFLLRHFMSDGSQLEGVASAGLGTAVVGNSPYGGGGYYTNKALNITSNLTVDVPDSAEVAYTRVSRDCS